MNTAAANSTKSAVKTIEDFVDSIATKTAMEAHTEPGDQDGGTSHPSKNVDDHTDDAEEGFRSAENEQDVKEDQGPPAVDNAPEATPSKSAGTQAENDHLQIGTNVTETGNDPSSETESVGSGKEDPGSDHPARTDNEELDGHKYAQADLDKMPYQELEKLAADSANDLLAYIAVQSDNETKQAESAPKSSAAPQPETPAADADFSKLANAIGYELAGLATGQNFDKQAAEAMVERELTDIIKTASNNADQVAAYLQSYHQTRQAEAQKGTSKQAMGMPPEMGGAAPMADPAAMMGGAPPEAAPAPAPEAGGGEEMDLQAILQMLGISEEELMAALAAEEGGGGEAPTAAPPEEEAPAEDSAPMEVEASDKGDDLSDPKVKAAAMDYIKEIVSRSRAKQAEAATGT